MWQDLSIRLNSAGFGNKSVEKWQKTWSDYKGGLKKRAAEIDRHQRQTGGGPPIEKQLSDLDLRLLNCLGETFFKGCGTEERGLANRVEAWTSSLPPVTPETPTTPNQEQEPTAGSSKRSGDWVPQKPKRLKLNNEESMYRETIQQLQKINENLNQFNATAQNIAKSLSVIASVITETLT